MVVSFHADYLYCAQRECKCVLFHKGKVDLPIRRPYVTEIKERTWHQCLYTSQRLYLFVRSVKYTKGSLFCTYNVDVRVKHKTCAQTACTIDFILSL